MALCRCGASQNKPLCDNAHKKIGFRDEGALQASESLPPTSGGGRVAIRPRPDGPLMCTGALTIIGTNGRAACDEAAFLCRCGGSQNKPYCDGTHRKIGFTD
jgi:CDGSH-type Zn-finger protein